MDIVNWFKENILPELDKKEKINTKLLKDIEIIIKHEYLHYKFYSIVDLDIELWINLKKEYDNELGLIVRTDGSCKLINNKRYFPPRYYFHLIISEIAHLIYDIIFDFLNFNFLKNFLFRVKRFLKNIIGNFEIKKIKRVIND
ncbi:hypothetical protein LCGC14_0931850 [marine sediment metagenome]|uniref:Uncharacterized protein n=1 Tax=marine sediment metagenome TaxID=412755 RepID=A0A0F9P8P9_9ZZZZ|nr:MAG: hypothetical protein Lokiarch_21400 [Candidatus Lokiarchaeum sp. GC14_75]